MLNRFFDIRFIFLAFIENLGDFMSAIQPSIGAVSAVKESGVCTVCRDFLWKKDDNRLCCSDIFDRACAQLSENSGESRCAFKAVKGSSKRKGASPERRVIGLRGFFLVI